MRSRNWDANSGLPGAGKEIGAPVLRASGPAFVRRRESFFVERRRILCPSGVAVQLGKEPVTTRIGPGRSISSQQLDRGIDLPQVHVHLGCPNPAIHLQPRGGCDCVDQKKGLSSIPCDASSGANSTVVWKSSGLKIVSVRQFGGCLGNVLLLLRADHRLREQTMHID